MIAANVRVGEVVVVALLAGVFALLGARRGVYVELYVLAGIAVGMLLADALGELLAPWINMWWRIAQAVIRDRATSPEALFDAVAQYDLLLKRPEHLRILGSVIYVWIVAAAYELGRRYARQKVNALVRVLGGAAGGVNGYLVAFFLFPRHVHTDRPMTITVPNPQVQGMLSVHLATVVVVVILVILAFGVLTTRRAK